MCQLRKILAEVDLIYGLNIEDREEKRKIFCSSLLLIEYLRIKRFEDCPAASSSRALTDDFYVTCFPGILCSYYEIIFVILYFMIWICEKAIIELKN